MAEIQNSDGMVPALRWPCAMDVPLKSRRYRPPPDNDGYRAFGRLRSGSAGAPDPHRTLVIFSEDEAVVQMIKSGLAQACAIEHANELTDPRSFLTKPGTAIVVVDDKAMRETHGTWLLDQVRKWAPNALVVYIAANHSPELERKARAVGVDYYASRPIDYDRTMRILRSFAGVIR